MTDWARHLQTVNKKQSPNQNDMVNFSEYDEYGRQSRNYLGYTDNSANGYYKNNVQTSQADFYKNALKTAHTNFPWADVEFDGSPFNMIEKMGAPGATWQIDENYSEMGYRLNTTTDHIRKWEIGANGTNCLSQSEYNANELICNHGTDENVKTTTIFKDMEGKIIAVESTKNNQKYYSYYIYDVFDRPVFFIPPKAVQMMKDLQTWNTSSLQEELVYRFEWDKRGRLVKMHTPGKDVVEYIYDNLDRLIMIQNGNQRSEGLWSFVKYDKLGRKIITGIFDDSSLPSSYGCGGYTMQEMYDYWISNGPTQNFERISENSPLSYHGYSNLAFPLLTATDECYQIYYYDNYDFTPSGFRNEYQDVGGFTNEQADRIYGKLTGVKIKVLDNTETWLYSAFFYDDRGRTIQTYSNNQFYNGYDEFTFQYDFNGKLLKSRQVQTALIDGAPHMYNINKRYVYDHAGRLLTEFQSFNDQPEVMIKQLQYNELGQIVDKSLHSTDQGARSYNPLTINTIFGDGLLI
ncbi:MAG: DUF6443 domain-containing protein [Bacteroidales bacterium]